MKCDYCQGTLIETETTYTIEFNGTMHMVEHVPVKYCSQCGEKLYSPDAVRKIQEAVWQNKKPDKFIQMPVLDYARI